MLERALDFGTTLQRRATDGPVNYIFLGDFNIMGMQYRMSDHGLLFFEVQRPPQ